MKEELNYTSEDKDVGRMDVILPEDLEEEFRAAVAKELGMRRGNLTLAMQKAIRLWIDKIHEREAVEECLKKKGSNG